MSVIPCPNKVDCDGSDFPITNYSAEGGEQVAQFFSVYFPKSWEAGGCLSVCVSEISQNDADLCALAQAALCPDPPAFCSVATTCSCESFDGSEFFYTTPAGTFCAETQEAADALAYSYACEHCSNPTTSIQLVGLDACTCLSVPYSSQITYQGSLPVAWIITAGSLPDGMTLNASTGLISGTPTETGTFSFTVRAFTRAGNYATKTMSIAVIAITTATIDPYTLGQAYSFQLQAAGGSGTYAWKINSGTLPTGLTMSLSGLITGTPTSAGTNPLVFQVIDTDCEAINSTYFTPSIAIATNATTVIRTRRGFPSFTSGNTLYKRADYSGHMTQIAHPGDTSSVTPQSAGAKYTYAGWDEIDLNGNITNRHTKFLSEMCTKDDPTVLLLFATPSGNILVTYTPMPILLGYCWTDDPSSCATCDVDESNWSPNGNWAKFGANDLPSGMLSGPYYTTTPTSLSYLGTIFQDNLVMVPSKPGFPQTVRDGTPYDLFVAISTGNWSIVLSSEFTEAEAIASQTSYGSSSKSSENKPNTITWVNNAITNIQSRYTSVNFSLNCTNLVEGSSYDVQYQLADSNGTSTAVLVSFVASGTTHVISGTLPTPAAGRTITIRNVTISYS